MGGSFGYWAAVVLLGKVVAQDFSKVNDYSSKGCYSGIPSSFSNQGSSSTNSVLACYTTCDNAGFTVMALQNQDCYCGNELPAGSADGSCDVSCPGYGSDTCGGSSAFNIYVKKGAAVSTAAAGGSSSSSVASSASSDTSSTVGSSSASSASSTSSDSASSTSASSSSDSSTSASSQQPSQATTTVSGSVVVSTVTATQPSSSQSSSTTSTTTSSEGSSASSSASASGTATKHSGISGGAIAGIVVGVVAGLAVLAAILFLLWRRRKEEFYSPNSSPHKFETSFNSGYNQEYPSIVDQRLNPQLLNHRISIASLADARDYSRQILKVANPDDKE